MEVFCRSAFNYDRDAASNETGIDCRYDPVTGEETPSLTQQHFAEECDINTIVRRFGITGEMPTGVRLPTYQDFTSVFDFKSAMDAVAKANESFDAMPAEVRARFQNDPQQFLEFVNREENRQEAIKLGLVLPKAQELAAPGAAPAPAPAPAPAQPIT